MSTVADVPVPQVLENLIEIAKLILNELFTDALTSQVNFVSIFLSIISEPFHELVQDTGPNAGLTFRSRLSLKKNVTLTQTKGRGRT